MRLSNEETQFLQLVLRERFLDQEPTICYETNVWDKFGAKPELVNILRKLDAVYRCPTFNECTKKICGGTVWCKIYHLGPDGSHSFTSTRYRHLGTHVADVPWGKRRAIMLKIVDETPEEGPDSSG